MTAFGSSSGARQRREAGIHAQKLTRLHVPQRKHSQRCQLPKNTMPCTPVYCTKLTKIHERKCEYQNQQTNVTPPLHGEQHGLPILRRPESSAARKPRMRSLSDYQSLAHAASEPSGAAPQDETRPRSNTLPHRRQVRKVQLFTHCSPKNFTACNFVATKRDSKAYKNKVVYQCWQLGGASCVTQRCNPKVWHGKRNPQPIPACHLNRDEIHLRKPAPAGAACAGY